MMLPTVVKAGGHHPGAQPSKLGRKFRSTEAQAWLGPKASIKGPTTFNLGLLSLQHL